MKVEIGWGLLVDHDPLLEFACGLSHDLKQLEKRHGPKTKKTKASPQGKAFYNGIFIGHIKEPPKIERKKEE